MKRLPDYDIIEEIHINIINPELEFIQVALTMLYELDTTIKEKKGGGQLWLPIQ